MVGPKEAETPRREIRYQPSEKYAPDTKPMGAQDGEGYQEHQDADGVENHGGYGHLQPSQDESAIAMRFHHAVTEGDDADIGH